MYASAAPAPLHYPTLSLGLDISVFMEVHVGGQQKADAAWHICCDQGYRPKHLPQFWQAEPLGKHRIDDYLQRLEL